MLVLGILPGVARAQGTGALRKAELVQLLATGALSKRDIAALVQRNCVTFQPSERDRGELRAAGADDAVLAAIDQCVRARVRPAPAPAPVPSAPTPAAPPTSAVPAALHVITTATVSAAAGTEASVVVQLLRGNAPQARVELRLRGTSAIPGAGLSHDAVAVTTRRGVATFRVPAGTTAGTYRLSVTLADGAVIGPEGQFDFVTTPAQLAGAQADPGEVTRGDFSVSVVDRYGNPIPGVPLELRPVTAQLAGPPLTGLSDQRGQAVFTLAPGSVRRAGEVAIWSREARIGAFGVRLAPQVLSDAGTQFTRGADRHGVVGTPLPEPLVLEVRDTSGAPIAGQAVTFAATNGGVAPTVAESDSGGLVRVRVTLGTRAGPVIVSAKVGGVTRTATVYADPGAGTELVVERDGAPVAGVVTVQSRDTVVLRVSARDAYGNEAALGDFTARTTGSAIAIRSATLGGGSRAAVTLEPERNGAGEVQIAAAGLHARVAVNVSVPAGLGGRWAVGMRAAWLGINRPWVSVASLQRMSGTAVTILGRRALGAGFSVALGAELGSVSMDTTGGSASATLLEGSARVERALLARRTVTPVLSLGAGGYRLKSVDNGQTIYHTNLFWAGGVGLDAGVSPTVTAELRVERQWMTDSPAGHVGTLWPIGAGLRVAF